MEELTANLKRAKGLEDLGMDMTEQIKALQDELKRQFNEDIAPLLKTATGKRSANELSDSGPIQVTQVKIDGGDERPAQKRKMPKKQQDQSIGHFFKTSITRVKLPNSNAIGSEILHPTSTTLQRVGTWSAFQCPRCKKQHENAQGLGMHRKTCESKCLLTGKPSVEALPVDDEVYFFGSNRADGPNSSKVAKSGKPKKTKGQKHRQRFTLRTKLQVLDYYRSIEFETLHPKAATIKEYPFCANGVLTHMLKNESEIRAAMRSCKFEVGKYADATACRTSRQAMKLSLHAGKRAAYPVAEEKTYTQYLSWRKVGIRVGGRTLKRLMKKHVKEEYGDGTASYFKASKKWLVLFAKRHHIALKRKTNKKSLPASERIPKVKTWFARLVRRLKRFTLSGSTESGGNGCSASKIISVQGASFEMEKPSELWGRDCGFAAIRNVTVDRSLKFDDFLRVVRPLQVDLEKRTGAVLANFLAEGTGDFNGIGLMGYLESRGYGCVQGTAHMSDLLEFLCLSFKSRITGVVWHEGADLKGHWLCASYFHSEVAFDERVWYRKDSVGPAVRQLQTKDVIEVLNNAVGMGQDCFIIMNCK